MKAAAAAVLAAIALAGCAAAPASRATPGAKSIAAAMSLRPVTVYTAASDPNHLLGRQHGYTSKVNFGPGGYSSIEVFADAGDLAARKTALASFVCPLGDGYDYQAGLALLRLSCADTPAQAGALAVRFRRAVTGSARG